MEGRQLTKILLVIPNLGAGGAQEVFRQQLRSLSDEFSVTGCVFNWDNALETDVTTQMVSLNVPGAKTIIGKAWRFIQRIRRLRALKRRLHTQVSISHLEGADYVNIISNVGEKGICWIHGTKEHDRNISGVLGLFRSRVMMPLLYRRATSIVTVSKGIAVELGRSYPALKGKLNIIHNGFDISKIKTMSLQPIDNEFALLFTGETIVTHCRLARQKNLMAMLKIFSLVERGRDLKLVIIGDGELREQLLQESRSLGMLTWDVWSDSKVNHSCKVFFLGYQENPYPLIRLGSFYVSTSSWEGFPLSLGEAIACGLTVMAADCPTGPREILGFNDVTGEPVKAPHYNDHGILMPLVEVTVPETLNKWVNEIEKLLNMSSVERKQKSSGELSNFTPSATLNKTINLIRELQGD